MTRAVTRARFLGLTNWSGELGDEDAGDLGEADIRGFFENEGDAAAPGLDELDAAEEIGDEGIAAAWRPWRF